MPGAAATPCSTEPRRGWALTPYGQARAANPKHIGWAMACTRRWVKSYPHLAEELRTAGLIGLLEAAAFYREGGNACFTTYLTDCVNHRCWRIHRDSLWSPRRPLPTARIKPWHEPRARDEPPPDLDPPTDLDALLTTLDDRSQAMVRLRYIDGQTLVAIAGAFDMSATRVQQIIARALARLRKRLDAPAPIHPPVALSPSVC